MVNGQVGNVDVTEILAQFAQLSEMFRTTLEAVTSQQRASAGGDGDTTDGRGEAHRINSLNSRTPKFEFDMEDGKTFVKYWTRYGNIFEKSEASEESKRQVLLGKLEDDVYDQFSASVAPKHPNELSFEEIVSLLKNMFDTQQSLFRKRFACMTLRKTDESPLAFTNKVNETCEKAQLADIKMEDWKCFFFLRGLENAQDVDMRNHLLDFMDYDKEAPKKTIKDLYEEWMRRLSLRADSEKIGGPSTVQQVRAFSKKKSKPNLVKDARDNEGQTRNGRRVTKDLSNVECWNCGKMGHYSRDCQQVINQAIVQCGNIGSNRLLLDAEIDGKMVKFQLDTGSDRTIISRSDWVKIGSPKLNQKASRIVCANGSELKLLGVFKGKININSDCCEGNVHVREHGTNLLGLDLTRSLPKMSGLLDLVTIEATKSVEMVEVEKKLDVFEEESQICLQVISLPELPDAGFEGRETESVSNELLSETSPNVEDSGSYVHVEYVGSESGLYFWVAVDAENGWQEFVSEMFAEFCADLEIEHIKIKSNSLSDRCRDTFHFSNSLKKREEMVSKIVLDKLIDYRSTPGRIGLSFVERKRLKIELDLLSKSKRELNGRNLEKIELNGLFDKICKIGVKSVEVGDTVYLEKYRQDKCFWEKAVVLKSLGPKSCRVRQNGKIRKVNFDDLFRDRKIKVFVNLAVDKFFVSVKSRQPIHTSQFHVTQPNIRPPSITNISTLSNHRKPSLSMSNPNVVSSHNPLSSSKVVCMHVERRYASLNDICLRPSRIPTLCVFPGCEIKACPPESSDTVCVNNKSFKSRLILKNPKINSAPPSRQSYSEDRGPAEKAENSQYPFQDYHQVNHDESTDQ
ncbi:unnamed protein product [Caenorhabditis angaria]|uniref:CCHC-type domain-containing protein n=1 Tax=Caenorhabditis angaria TaxID=860376 RepID=A0A9P1IUD8_9PELO|nr:unnamed protein product [Caenorhabditis angaria]